MDGHLYLFAAISFALSLGLVLLNRRVSNRRNDLRAVQAMHLRPTSRFGGLAVLTTFSLGLLIWPTTANSQILHLVVCVLPIFLVGISEDAGWHVTPRWRLIAAVVSSLLGSRPIDFRLLA